MNSSESELSHPRSVHWCLLVPLHDSAVSACLMASAFAAVPAASLVLVQHLQAPVSAMLESEF